MEAVSFVLDDRAWTRAERDALPADGSRYELVDGALVVTPSPRPVHQVVSVALVVALSKELPRDLAVLHAPVDVHLGDDTVVQPDVLVVSRSQMSSIALKGAPLLVVEILSPSTQVIDRNLKFCRYEQAGVPSYWLADPDAATLTAYEIDETGRYEQVAHVVGDEPWTATHPFAVTLSAAALVR